MSDSRIPVVLFGHGGIGRHHLRLLRANPNVQVVAVVDPSLPLLDGILVVASFDDIASHDLLQPSVAKRVAIIATPISTHFKISEAMLLKGFEVFVEKPIVPEYSQAQILCELAQQKNVALAVGHSERHNPAFITFAEQFRKGITGQVYRIECNRTGPFPQRVGDAGATIDLAVHDLDSLNFIMDNEPPQWVFARNEQRINAHYDDGLNAMLGYANNTLVQMTVNWLSPRKTRVLNVFGHHGMLQCDFAAQKVTFFENLYTRSRPDEYGMGGIEVGPETNFPVPQWEPLAREHECFFRAVQYGMNADDIAALRSASLAVQTANRLLASGRQQIPVETHG